MPWWQGPTQPDDAQFRGNKGPTQPDDALFRGDKGPTQPDDALFRGDKGPTHPLDAPNRGDRDSSVFKNTQAYRNSYVRLKLLRNSVLTLYFKVARISLTVRFF